MTTMRHDNGQRPYHDVSLAVMDDEPHFVIKGTANGSPMVIANRPNGEERRRPIVLAVCSIWVRSWRPSQTTMT